jgi:hypothetical protein
MRDGDKEDEDEEDDKREDNSAIAYMRSIHVQ